MWNGGVRAIIFDDRDRLLLVRQAHPERDFWLVPGGAIEKGETSEQALIREVREETGLSVRPVKLIWHIEEVSEKRGMRFVNYFLAEITNGTPELGRDPEMSDSEQVLVDLRFVSKEEMCDIGDIYPDMLRKEIWDVLDRIDTYDNSYRLRTDDINGKTSIAFNEGRRTK